MESDERWIDACNLKALLNLDGEIVGVSVRGDGDEKQVGFKLLADE